jgi:hypothetical protein
MTNIVRDHAPHLLHQISPTATRNQDLAAGLAKEGVLVLVAQPLEYARIEYNTLIQQWFNPYAALYHLLTDALFKSLTNMKAAAYPEALPLVLLIEGDAIFVMRALAGYITPYLAARQGEKLISEAELRGVITMVLEDLEGNDLPTPQYDRLCSEGMALLRTLRTLPLYHVSLTGFKRPLFQELQIPQPPPPPPPPNLPEIGKVPAAVKPSGEPAKTEGATEPVEPIKSETQELFASKIPIFFKRNGNGGNGDKPKPRPPVPPPHKKDG